MLERPAEDGACVALRGGGHRHQLCALGADALADEIDRLVGVVIEEAGDYLGDALVDLPEERFVSRETFVSCRHQLIFSI